MRTLLLIVVSIFLVIPAKAQDADFRIFYFKGTSEIFTAAKPKTPVAISAIGGALSKGDKVKLYAGAELVLIHKSGASVKLNVAKTYQVSELLSSLSSNPDKSVVSAYLSYVWEELNSEHSDLDEYSRSHMRDKGVVNRGCRQPIMVNPPFGSAIDSGEIRFDWEPAAAGRYEFVLYNTDDGGPELLKIYTEKVDLTISAASFFLKPGSTYFWTVYPEGDPNCARFSFRVMPSDEQSQMELQLTELKAGLTLSEDMNQIILASFYEKYNLYDEAGACYVKAIKLAPDNSGFSNMYALFLARTGKAAEAKKYLKQ
jgi:hypothetical protein